MKIINSMFFSIFSGIIFFCILFSSMSNNMNILSTILLTLIFLPLFLASFWQGLKSFIPIIIAVIVIVFFSVDLAILITILFLLPSLIISLITLRYKNVNLGDILAIIAFYTVIVCSSILIYYGFISEHSIHNVVYDTITFLSIYANQYMGEEFRSIPNLSQQIDILAFILPAIVSIMYTILLFFNYRLAIKISLQSNDLLNKEIITKYKLPTFYTCIFIILTICTLFSHNFLDNNQNLYYIFYNILFILCFGYFYSGFSFLWNKIKSRNSLLMNILYILFVIVLFVELIFIFIILGFIIETKRIIFKNNM